jgi:predicted O-methyltransferase YrrM
MNNARTLLDRIYTDFEFAHAIADDLFPVSINRDQGIFIAKVIDRHKPKVVVELGFRYGISSLWVHSATHRPSSHIIIDPYHHIPNPPKRFTIDTFIRKQKGVILEDHMTSQEYLAKLLRQKTKVDMVFVDASQWFDSVMTDMYFVARILRLKGIVVIRNIWSKPVRKAVMYYLKNLPFTVVGIAPWQEWVIKHVPVVGELLLRVLIRPLDLCVMRLTHVDNRDWDSYIPF